MLYQTKKGDSPRQIAQRYRVPFDRLITANAHKPTTVVAGQRTWRELLPNETIIVPVGGLIGDAWSDAIKPLVDAGGPCLQANVALVCAAQRSLGVTADGKWGSNSAAAARGIAGAPPACSPRPSWWAPPGQSNCPAGAAPAASAPPAAGSSLDRAASAALAALLGDPNYCVSVKRAGSPVNTAIHNFKAAWNAANPSNPVPIGTGNYEPIVQIALALALNTQQSNVPPGCGAGAAAPAPAPMPAPSPGPGAAAGAASAALAALTADPNYCTSVSRVGSPVNTAVHNFKAAWNAANPSNPVPIGTGKYEPVVASALSSALGGVNVPPGCGAGAAAPAPAPMPAPSPGPGAAAAPAAVQMLLGLNPCLQTNVEIVRAAQRTLGLTPDGKYGNDTSTAARRLAPSAPAACSPAPSWWGSKGVPAPPGPPAPPPPPPGPPPPAPAPGGTTVVAEKKGLSTGAIVAGAVGAAALVGLIAVAMTGKKKHGHGHARRHGAHKSHRKPTHHGKRRRK